MAFLAEKLISASGATEETDDDFNLVTGLYHFDGSNGAQNNTFLDSSSNSFSVTRRGDATQGTFSPFSSDEGKWSIFFDGTDDYLRLPSSSDFDFSGSFTIEAWVYLQDLSTSRTILGTCANISNRGGIYFGTSGNNLIFFEYITNTTLITSSSSITKHQWNHVAAVRNGTSITLYINGTSVGSATDSRSYSGDSANGGVGGFYSNPGVYYLDGFMSNMRVVNGTAVYTSNFTPPTAPLTAVTNTKLLIGCSNRFRDKSTSAHTITTGSTPEIKPFSPFAPSAAYDSAVNGGSMFSDGTGDGAGIAANTALDVLDNGTFTIDFWFYRTNSLGTYSDYVGIFNGVSSGLLIYQYGTQFQVYINGSTIFNVTHPNLNEWIHVALTRDGTTLRLFLNGVASGTSTASLGTSNQPLSIAADGTGRVGMGGFMSDVRVVKGTAVYTSAFTPPTAPSTAITNTEALLSFTNAAAFDQTGKTNAETLGNAQTSTATTAKFGTASLKLDGTSDSLKLINVIPINTSQFTLEFFFRSNTTSLDTYYRRMYKMATVTSQNNAWCEICINTSTGSYGSGNNIFMYTPGNTIIGTATPFDNNWHHFALTRDTSNNLKMFVDGTQDGSTVTGFTNDLTQTEHLVGANDTTGNGDFLGYIDELRLTMKARYTSNFTAPTKAFPNL
tara:strand:- start:374 stop:2386 length:2013 start_codon:yes stop_codon:yes gene_type:complete